jgi:hypothetical protein
MQAASEAEQAWKETDFFDHDCDKIILYVRTCQEAEDQILSHMGKRKTHCMERGYR